MDERNLKMNDNKNPNTNNNQNSDFDILRRKRNSPSPQQSANFSPVSRPSYQHKTNVIDFDEIDPENARLRRTKKVQRRVKSGVGAALNLFKILVYVAAVVAVSGIIASYIISAGNDRFAFVKDDINVTITIPEKADIGDVAKLLKKNGIIKHQSLFASFAKKEIKESKYYNGEFKTGDIHFVFVNKTEDAAQITDGNYTEYIQLSKEEDSTTKPLNYERILSMVAVSTYKPRESVRVTIPEGYTVDEIITLLISKGVGEREKYIDVIQNYDYEYRFVKEIKDNPDRKYRLEGYLFPDTYDFFTNESEISVINKMLSNFEVKFEEVYYERADKLGYTVDELIILASILQKEARYAQDYPLMSSVFHHRLDDNYRLESDATILYVISDFEKEEDAKKSPYNSYETVGLIPGAISNPGLEAISAAFYPESTNYYYFFSLKNGSTVYSRTHDQHLTALNKAKSEGTYAS